MNNYIEQFRNKMMAARLNPPTNLIADGEIHRFSTNQKANDLAGWYVLHPNDIPAGSFGDWRTGFVSSWCAKSSDQMTFDDWRKHRLIMDSIFQKRNLARTQEQQEAAQRAVNIWREAKPASPRHTYLLKKKIAPFIARKCGRSLIVPITDFEGEIQSLQFIDRDGSKRLLWNGAKKGLFIPVNGLIHPQRLLICEGFATGATLASAYPDKCVIAAIDAGNLESVTVGARRRWPDSDILICADDDRLTQGNPGRTKARQAAIAAGVPFSTPIWPKGAPDSLTDFNDLSCWLAGRVKVAP